MILLDQFETEPSQIYSGSSLNEQVLGEVLSDSPTRERRIVTTALEGLSEGFGGFNLSYSDRLNFVSGTAFQSLSSLRFKRSISQEEFYFDSFLPSPAAIGDINGVSRPYISGNVAGLFVSARVSGNQTFGRLPVPDESLHTWFSADGRPLPDQDLTFPADAFTDINWQQSPYPFQTKYRKIPRSLSPGTRFSTDGEITADLTNTSIVPSLGTIRTSRIGGLFLAWSDPQRPFTDWSQFSQIWSVTSSVIQPIDPNNRFVHRFTEGWNGFNDVIWNPFTGSNSAGVYVAVGNNLSMFESRDGIEWTAIAKGQRGSQGSPNAVDDLLVINTSSVALPISPTGSNDIFRIHAEAYNSGIHRRWFLLVGFGAGSFGGQLVRSTTISVNRTSKTGWETIDVSGLGTNARFYDIGTTDPGGNEANTADTLILVGEDTTGVDTGYIGFATSKDGTTWARSTAGVANQSDVRWYGVTTGDATHNYNFVCGVDFAGFPDEGIIARAPVTLTSPNLQTWTNITPSSASFGLASIPILYDIDYSETTNTVITVGDNGCILRSTDGGTSWSKPSPPSGFVGKYIRVYARPNSVGWFAMAQGDGVHYSTNDGLSWNRSNYDLSNRNNAESYVGNGALVVGSREALDSGATLPQPQQIVWVDQSNTHPWGLSGDSTIIVFRLHDAEFETSGNVNKAALVEPGGFLSGGLLISPSVADFNKTFFGFGEGIDVDLSDYYYGGKLRTVNNGKSLGKGILPSFRDFSMYDMYGIPDACTVRLYGPEIRGWKYGIYNGVPTGTSVVHRANRFGQFRDMLEQRHFTAVLDRRNGGVAVQYPVDIAFKEGTALAASASIYATATDSVSFNPEDSGTYDIHYRVGKPFTDVDNRA